MHLELLQRARRKETGARPPLPPQPASDVTDVRISRALGALGRTTGTTTGTAASSRCETSEEEIEQAEAPKRASTFHAVSVSRRDLPVRVGSTELVSGSLRRDPDTSDRV